MEESTSSRSERWRERFRYFRLNIKKGLPFAAGVLAAFLAIWLYNTILPAPRPLTPTEVGNIAAQVLASATPQPAFSERVYQIIQPSLVLVQSKLSGANGTPEDSLGSGVVIDDQGDILTCLHVVAHATSIQLTFADGTQSTAQVTNTQPQNDIAVLRADNPPAQLVPATLGNLNAMQIGDQAYVVGNPFGLYGSMSAGVISGFNRSFQPTSGGPELKGLIQIDAAANPGNSGGPLLNRDGQVIGIVEGIVNPTGQDVFIGIAFAVPINTAGGALGSPPD
ncbi:MAG: trypsin-like peptidase domain-containing protein [Chloroflexi bacterium]|nr:trypsin-like peptidase domain-containing protein [Chloroflexota bacterium]